MMRMTTMLAVMLTTTNRDDGVNRGSVGEVSNEAFDVGVAKGAIFKLEVDDGGHRMHQEGHRTILVLLVMRTVKGSSVNG
jgi:hypothetical protein